MISKEIETFEQMIHMDIRKLQFNINKSKFKPKNLTPSEYKGYIQLKQDHDLVIKSADKGGGVVVLDREQYHQEAMRLLSDQSTYQILNTDPTNSIKELFSEFLQKGKDKGILNDREFKYLKVDHPRIPVFYHLPKLHKNNINPPGRPIVSGINSVSCKISEYIDHLLQPLVVKTSAYLKDTITVLHLLQDLTWEEGFLMATCDVSSLYTIISHEAGCEAVEFFLRQADVFVDEQVDFILKGIRLILHNNYFWYHDTYYLQTHGTAMGTRFAPSYANLFMAHWENSAVWTGHGWGSSLVLYKCYIDDILIIWKGTKVQLEDFISHLNHNPLGIKLEYNISCEQVNFLDLNLYVKEGHIETSTH
uniref:Reverse transcriptase domain-containing protein n=1 Tax=Leptobrachium leishanense TaxID=445787 RepID=A0A8C5WAS4_9ANUR